MTDTVDKFYVMAHRSAASVLGAASSPCKQDNEVLYLPEKEAREWAEKLNKNRYSPNVSYTVEPA